MKGDWADPKELIAEAYRIDGIGASECRSIFLDWALSLPDGTEPRAALEALVARHAAVRTGHPMSQVLIDGMEQSRPAGRRGGWRSRRRDQDPPAG